ncbi:hypothetical protein [Agromyces sp. SYSU T0242]
MIDRTMAPYLIGFTLCVGSVLGLAACTTGTEGEGRAAGAAAVEVLGAH